MQKVAPISTSRHFVHTQQMWFPQMPAHAHDSGWRAKSECPFRPTHAHDSGWRAKSECPCRQSCCIPVLALELNLRTEEAIIQITWGPKYLFSYSAIIFDLRREANLPILKANRVCPSRLHCKILLTLEQHTLQILGRWYSPTGATLWFWWHQCRQNTRSRSPASTLISRASL